MTPTSVSRRLYFDHVDGRTVCVGIDGYAGAYFASDTRSMPEALDPVGMTEHEIEEEEAEAARARSRAFVARRLAARQPPSEGDGSSPDREP